MIAAAVTMALGQLPDPRFRRVLILGVGLSLGLLFLVTLGINVLALRIVHKYREAYD